jgi:hypothetical protein
MFDYRLHPITWKNVIDYNDYNYKLRLPHVWQQLVETPIGTILTWAYIGAGHYA